MASKVTNYDVGEFLKSEGFGVASRPFEQAVQGNTVLILAPTAAAADACQRSYYKKLGDTQIGFKAKKWRIDFDSGGRLEIFTPSVNINIFNRLDREKTFYYLYRE